jgi:mannitol-1-phosphate 5-dehydrogenase
MGSTEKRTFVGFGLGAIQSGLFLYEAQVSGNFDRLVVAEVVPETVRRVRENGGFINVNIAHPTHIEVARVGPVEVLNPAVDTERQLLVDALASAQEISTAVPGVAFYRNTQGPQAISRILAAGMQAKIVQNGPRVVIYAAENHNHAAEILQEYTLDEIPPSEQAAILSQVRFLNTVIGKMSGVISDPAEARSLGLTPMMPCTERSFLVEAFNHILISRIHFAGSEFNRGITTFIEKDDLLPFEEAKLFGHNATHALGAYLGMLLGAPRIADLPAVPGIMAFLRRAFIDESGSSLIHRYNGIDPLFTPEGYAWYADDLLARMVNPFLADTVERVGRDVERKLGWDDRLIGTLRLGLAEGVRPTRYALGAAAALVALDGSYLTNTAHPGERLVALWGDHAQDPQSAAVLELVQEALGHLRRWQANCPGDSQALLKDL